MTVLTIAPSPEDIAEASKGDISQCAIARYVNRTYPQYTHVRVDKSHIYMTDLDERIRLKWVTSSKVAKWIGLFDRDMLHRNPGTSVDISFRLDTKNAEIIPMAQRTSVDRLRARQYQQSMKLARQNETPEQAEARKARNASRRSAQRQGV